MRRAAFAPSNDLRPTPLLRITLLPFRRRWTAAIIAAIVFVAVLVMQVGSVWAQQAPLHLNPAVENSRVEKR